MSPGFLSLFSRSLYRGSAARLGLLEPESEEYQHVHLERERFAAAAIAFCLYHDEVFLWHFWRKVCGGTTELKPKTKPTVEIEPRRWSDLLFTWEKTLCAVEIKIGAMLEDHQNPNKEAFSKKNGYGHSLSALCRERKCKGRYVVFGWEEDIVPRSKGNILGLEVEQRKWSDLENGLPSSALTADLTALLNGFGIWEFTFRAMKDKKLSGKLGDFGSAVAILESVRDSLKWPASIKVIADPGGDGIASGFGIPLGAYWRNKAVNDLGERLERDNDLREDDMVAWFGYFAKPGNTAKRCVYLYCSKGARKRLVQRLKSAGFKVDKDTSQDQGGPYCAVVDDGHAELGDVTWFKRALEAGAASAL